MINWFLFIGTHWEAGSLWFTE